MLKKTIPGCALLFLLIWGCTKKEVQQIDLKGDLKVKVSTVSEFGNYVNDKANIEITVEGTNPETKVFTDTSGSYTINALPLGTYNLIISKDGYGTMKYQSLKFIGSDVPYSFSTSLVQKSTTKVKSYNLSISGNTLTFSGIISHHYPISSYYSYPYSWPGLTIYVSDSPEVSSSNYLYGNSFNSNKDVDTTFNNSLYISASVFPKGSTVYAIIYGTNRFSYSVYDYEKGIYYDPAMGDPSEVKSIVVP